MNLLKFHKEVISTLMTNPENKQVDGDGLVIMSRGLGIRKILLAFLNIYSHNKNLVILLNTSQQEIESLKQELAKIQKTKNGQSFLKVINNETPSSERHAIYIKGGMLAITSRILVVDMLNRTIPTHLITGFLINHAHNITETSMEAFILRLFRQENKVGFIKAFSDSPESFIYGIWKLEKTMRTLFLRNVYFWPRFHLAVSKELEKNSIRVIEIRVPLSPNMKNIQTSLIECLEATLLDIKKITNYIDVDFNIENALFRSFDKIVRNQLNPIWYSISNRAKKIVGDLKTIRSLIDYLLSYDCVAFYSLLETILAENAPTSIFQQENSPWLLLDAANTVFSLSKNRVYINTTNPRDLEKCKVTPELKRLLSKNTLPILEELPKWKVLKKELDPSQQKIKIEIKKENEEEEDENKKILIMVNSRRTSLQLKMILSLFKKNELNGSYYLMNKLLENYFLWKKKLAYVNKNPNGPVNNDRKTSNFQKNTNTSKPGGRYASLNNSGNVGGSRRRIRRGKSSSNINFIQTHISNSINDEEKIKLEVKNDENDKNDNDETKKRNEDEEQEFGEYLPFDIQIDEEMENDDENIIIREYSNTRFLRQSDMEDDYKMLEDISPDYVIIYDPNLNFIRNLEIYCASLKKKKIPKVYMLIYDNSIEEQRYLSQIRREKYAFERLIKEKSIMSIPIDQDGRIKLQPEDDFWKEINTRIAGGQLEKGYKKQIIVDVREFRCSLPLLIHTKEINVKPCTLIVGDYILTPTHCVERKSVNDLIQSFKSGRLYNQVESMSTYYKQPILLIEFNQDKSFLLQSVNKSEISNEDIQSKIVLLLLAFPNLKILWASSPYASSEMFDDIKKSQKEPDEQEALSKGTELLEKNNQEKSYNPYTQYNVTPQEMLLSIPGVNYKNYRIIMNNVENIYELSQMTVDQLNPLVGIESARLIYNFFNSTPKDKLV
ncbi:hypothetical protein BCR36DRAFT_291953 [Piromyces finnis]|uniref:ERCC4 domain-containing protein n=1 Tax=Piromyces finnis TaxID=1754191 RepID=A0A1Y1V854_9FUNG|nr:hypothetical protein BCR36DRAFT_291953 [Piromyces finnis]|eukprot:ORX49370.1 hypothetical protein BCR36DRAFT_291953 [Piromyces finnis]